MKTKVRIIVVLGYLRRIKHFHRFKVFLIISVARRRDNSVFSTWKLVFSFSMKSSAFLFLLLDMGLSLVERVEARRICFFCSSCNSGVRIGIILKT